ncbi:BMP family protein [Micromonospora inyonensis]|uniref:Basic membrane protein A n=1 Tax=Micromonospora inyonensis TaxID=47866 RepID=A0A1C6SDI7_9ACTN|nr:BMP family protein [Micromonospora inyonensis]SCL27429.1 basic membrane protein A [Micromonospora inyonensis]
MKLKLCTRRGNSTPRRVAAAVTSLALAGLTMSACGSDSGNSSDGATKGAPKVAILTSVGLKDSGLGRMTQAGGDEIAKKFGADVDVEGDIKAETWADTFRNYASRGYNLVIANDITGQAAALEVGPEFPDTDFVIVGGYKSQAPNVSAVTNDYKDGGYLAGLAAGVATKTNHVAGIGADDSIAPIKELMDGYAAGVKKVNPGATVDISYTGIPTGDPIKATQQATAALDKGADVIFGITNDGQPGLFKAAENAGAYAIGFGVDENEMAPKTVITSLVFDFVGMMVRTFERYHAGSLAPEVVSEGYKQDVFSLADFRGLLPNDKVSEINANVAAATAN